MEGPRISKIRIYPLKSLDPIELKEAEVGIHSLKHDREFAILAEDGRYVNGKRTGRVNQLEAAYDLTNYKVTLGLRGDSNTETFDLKPDNKELNEFLSNFFDLNVQLVQNHEGSLMDMPRVSSITILSTASLLSLQKDLTGHSLEDLRLRFRANLEIDGVEPFWEEKLFGEEKTGVRYSAGEVELMGISPRARCNVPPRNPLTGDTDKLFVKQMMDSRTNSLPQGNLLRDYKNLYYLTVNTYLAENQKGKILRCGDKVEILEKVSLT